MEDDNSKRTMIILILIIIIIILLYFLFRKFGNINNQGIMVPTGNVDMFEIDCSCNCDKNAFNELNDDKNNPNKGLIVEDKHAVWSNKELRIFSNPAYEYKDIIAPGSKNSYAFVIRNNNAFDVVVDIIMTEENPYNVNMKYKLKHLGNYLVGTSTKYDDVSKLKVEHVVIKSQESKSYILDWKWEHSNNDTEVGTSIGAKYKLNIKIGIDAL